MKSAHPRRALNTIETLVRHHHRNRTRTIRSPGEVTQIPVLPTQSIRSARCRFDNAPRSDACSIHRNLARIVSPRASYQSFAQRDMADLLMAALMRRHQTAERALQHCSAQFRRGRQPGGKCVFHAFQYEMGTPREYSEIRVHDQGYTTCWYEQTETSCVDHVRPPSNEMSQCSFTHTT